MPAVPPRVTPAQADSAVPGNLFAGEPASVTQAWQLFQGAFGYWLPAGLNQAVSHAKALRTIK